MRVESSVCRTVDGKRNIHIFIQNENRTGDYHHINKYRTMFKRKLISY